MNNTAADNRRHVRVLKRWHTKDATHYYVVQVERLLNTDDENPRMVNQWCNWPWLDTATRFEKEDAALQIAKQLAAGEDPAMDVCVFESAPL